MPQWILKRRRDARTRLQDGAGARPTTTWKDHLKGTEDVKDEHPSSSSHWLTWAQDFFSASASPQRTQSWTSAALGQLSLGLGLGTVAAAKSRRPEAAAVEPVAEGVMAPEVALPEELKDEEEVSEQSAEEWWVARELGGWLQRLRHIVPVTPEPQQSKPHSVSGYWRRMGVDVGPTAEARGRRCTVTEIDTLIQACWLSRLVYDLPSSPESFTDELQRQTGGCLIASSIGAPYTEQGPLLGWLATDCLVQGERTRIIAIRGSAELSDWVLNLDFEPVPFEPQLQSRTNPVLAHRGFYRAARALLQDAALKKAVAEAVAQGQKVAFTGHSLGGSAAMLLAVLTVLHGFVPPQLLRGVWTFGAAEALCVRARHMMRRCGIERHHIVNVVNLHDAVPRLTCCAYPEFFTNMVLDKEVTSFGFNPYTKFCEAVGVPAPNPARWQSHAAFLVSSRLCEPVGVVAHLVPDGRRGEGLRADLIEDLGDVHAALDTPGLSVILNNTSALLSLHSTGAYLRALRNARRWASRGGALRAAIERNAAAVSKVDPLSLLSSTKGAGPTAWRSSPSFVERSKEDLEGAKLAAQVLARVTTEDVASSALVKER